MEQWLVTMAIIHVLLAPRTLDSIRNFDPSTMVDLAGLAFTCKNCITITNDVSYNSCYLSNYSNFGTSNNICGVGSTNQRGESTNLLSTIIHIGRIYANLFFAINLIKCVQIETSFANKEINVPLMFITKANIFCGVTTMISWTHWFYATIITTSKFEPIVLFKLMATLCENEAHHTITKHDFFTISLQLKWL